MGYGTLSLSLRLSNVTLDLGVVLPCTTTYGMPMREPSQRPEPKSACTEPPPIAAITAAESAATGSLSTFAFQTLAAGKTGQPPSFGGVAAAEPANPATSASASSFTVAGVAPANPPRFA